MALSINGEIFYKQIFPKVKYDKIIGKYRIDVSDYILLKLTKKQLRVLENICKRNNIYLEKLPELITIEETKTLFIKLKELKEQIKNNPNNSDIKNLEKEYYQVKNKIFESHQIIIYRIIATSLPEYLKTDYKEDIIQLGYENLLHAIDKYDVERGATFRWYLYNYVLDDILRQIRYLKIDVTSNKDLLKIIETRNKLEQESITNITIELLSAETGLKPERIKDLLVLEQILTADSIENLIESEDKNFYNDSGLIDEIKEDKIYYETFKKSLLSIIDTLPNEYQKQVIILFYGLNFQTSISYSKIADNLGKSRQRVDQHKNDAIANLQHPARAKYIEEIVETYTQIDLPKELLENFSIDETETLVEKLELFLIQYVPQEELLEVIMQIEPKYREVLLYHFKLKGDKNIQYNEKMKILGICPSTYINRKRIGLLKLSQILKNKYENIDNTLDYLMYNYLNNQSHTKKRSK